MESIMNVRTKARRAACGPRRRNRVYQRRRRRIEKLAGKYISSVIGFLLDYPANTDTVSVLMLSREYPGNPRESILLSTSKQLDNVEIF